MNKTADGLMVFAFFLCTAYGLQAANIELGVDRQPPGGEARLPVTISPPPGVQLASITIEINFPHNLLSYQSVRKGPALQSEGSELQVTVEKNPKDLNRSVLRFSATGRRALSGLIADLLFQISKEAKPGEIMRLKNTVTARDLNGKTVAGLKTREGVVSVTPHPKAALSCFFYMH